jgi:hypothetical protein
MLCEQTRKGSSTTIVNKDAANLKESARKRERERGRSQAWNVGTTVVAVVVAVAVTVDVISNRVKTNSNEDL